MKIYFSRIYLLPNSTNQYLGVDWQKLLGDFPLFFIGKVIVNVEDPSRTVDASEFPKKGQLGFVDKSFITEGEEGFRIAKNDLM